MIYCYDGTFKRAMSRKIFLQLKLIFPMIDFDIGILSMVIKQIILISIVNYFSYYNYYFTIIIFVFITSIIILVINKYYHHLLITIIIVATIAVMTITRSNCRGIFSLPWLLLLVVDYYFFGYLDMIIVVGFCY